MASDFLREFGPERRISPALSLSDGGIEPKKSIDYSPPAGPIGLMSTSPHGLGGTNLGNRGSQETRNVFGDGAGGMSTQGVTKTIQGRH